MRYQGFISGHVRNGGKGEVSFLARKAIRASLLELKYKGK